jgi:hypothetical protein
MIKRPVYPIRVKYKDQEEACMVESPYYLRDGIAFKVLAVRVFQEDHHEPKGKSTGFTPALFSSKPQRIT